LRYHIHGHFVEEQRKGFAVHHQIDVTAETYAELQDKYDSFLSSYLPKYCYGLSVGISEEPTLVE